MNDGKRLIKQTAALMLAFCLLCMCGCQTAAPDGTSASTAAATVPTTEPATVPITEPTTEPTTAPTTEPVTEPTEPATQPTEPYVPEGELSFHAFQGSYDFTFSVKGKQFQLYNGTIPVEYVNFYSANESVAVIKDGVVEMIGGGVTKVYAECNGETISCIIRCAFAPLANAQPVPNPEPAPKPTDPAPVKPAEPAPEPTEPATEPAPEPTEPATEPAPKPTEPATDPVPEPTEPAVPPEETQPSEPVEDLADQQYAENVAAMSIFNNTVEQALPQTRIHDLVMNHFNSGGPGVKKAIVIGYDGFRTDGLENVQGMWNSGTNYLRGKGGLYHSFAGGILGSNEQKTYSGPGWASILTGGWSDYHGATEAESPKNGVKTFLTKLAEMGHAGAFTVSWPGHLDSIFRPDVAYAEANGLPIEYTCQSGDKATYQKVLDYVTKTDGVEKTAQEDPDVIFLTLEYTDTAGHNWGYGNDRPLYVDACQYADDTGYYIIQAIESRSTYAQEDWLIIITTDHGGLGMFHGNQSNAERMTWIACNKPIF